jgi:hypothetical protein
MRNHHTCHFLGPQVVVIQVKKNYKEENYDEKATSQAHGLWTGKYNKERDTKTKCKS